RAPSPAVVQALQEAPKLSQPSRDAITDALGKGLKAPNDAKFEAALRAYLTIETKSDPKKSGAELLNQLSQLNLPKNRVSKYVSLSGDGSAVLLSDKSGRIAE